MIYIAGKISGEVSTFELLEKCYNKFQDYALSIYPDCLQRNRHTSGYYYFNNGNNLYTGNKKFTHGLLINKDLIDNQVGEWSAYMKNDISVLMKCNEAHFLPDWQDSKGAKIEHQLCLDLGIPIIYA